jgi:hypothetical protein
MCRPIDASAWIASVGRKKHALAGNHQHQGLLFQEE